MTRLSELQDWPSNSGEGEQPRRYGQAMATIMISSVDLTKLGWAVAGGAADAVITLHARRVAARLELIDVWPGNDAEFHAPDELHIDWARRTIALNDNRARLTSTELRLLSALAAANGEPVTRAALIMDLWGAPATHDLENALTVFVCSVRKRLSSIGAGDKLQTIRGLGYRLRL